MSKAYVGPSEPTRYSLARLRGTYRAHLFLSDSPDALQRPERSAVKKVVEGDVYRIHPFRSSTLYTPSLESTL